MGFQKLAEARASRCDRGPRRADGFAEVVQTAHGPLTEVRLDPSVTYAYLYPAPADHPSGPVWTRLLDHLDPNQEVRFTLEKRRGDVVVHTNPAGGLPPRRPGRVRRGDPGNLY